MTNKKIICNGVDVSKCKQHRKCILPDNIGCKIDDMLCCDKPNCEYKQLARKIAECEELKKQCDEHRSNAESYCRSYQNSCIVNGKITNRALRYKQALDEIYGIIVKLFITKDVKHLSKEINEILDIINKAKGKNNGQKI